MLQFRTKIKCLFVLFFVVCSLSFTGCLNAVETEPSELKPTAEAAAEVCKVSGKIDLRGAIPANTFQSSNNSRSIFPHVGTAADYYYKINAISTSASSAKTLSFQLGQETSYSITLPCRSWKLVAEGYEDAAYTKRVLSGVICEDEDFSSPAVTLNSATLKPVSTDTGTGNVDLIFILESETNIVSGTASFNGTTQPLDNSDVVSLSFNLTDYPCGLYDVTFSFYDDKNQLVYFIKEPLYIFENLTTNLWVSSAPYVSAEGIIHLTSSHTSQFKMTSFYVSSDGSDSGTGGYFSPFKTIQHAVDVIKAINNPEVIYSINLLSDITAEADACENDAVNGKSFVCIDSPDKKLNLKIESYGNEPEPYKIDANGSITGARVIFEGQNVNLELERVSITGGRFTEFKNADTNNGTGIFVNGISGSNSVLTANNCIFIENGISEYTTSNGGSLCAKNASINITNSKICNNYAKHGGGVYMYYDSDLYMEESDVYMNHSENTGGGFWLGNRSSSKSNIINSSIYSNTSEGGGGGVYSKGWIVIEDCLIYDNAAAISGGGICINQRSFTVKGVCKIYNNRATKGGAVSIISENDSSFFEFEGNSQIYSNTASENIGNEVYVSNSSSEKISTANIKSGSIINDDADNSVYIESGILNYNLTASIDKLYIKEAFNITGGPKGSSTKLTVSDTFASGQAVATGVDYTITNDDLTFFELQNSGSTLSLSDNKIELITGATPIVYSNWSELCAAVAAIPAGTTTKTTFCISGTMTADQTLTVNAPVKLMTVSDECTITRDAAFSDAVISVTSELFLYGEETARITFDGNNVMVSSPFISVNNGALDIQYSDIKNCHSTSSGAAVYINTTENANFVSCKFINNMVDASAAEGSSGAAIYFEGTTTSSSFYVSDSQFDLNRVEANSGTGGAIRINTKANDDIRMNECNFSDNYAKANGGAIYTAKGSVYFEDINMQGNKVGDDAVQDVYVTNQSGGLYLYGSLTLPEVYIANNSGNRPTVIQCGYVEFLSPMAVDYAYKDFNLTAYEVITQDEYSGTLSESITSITPPSGYKFKVVDTAAYLELVP